MKLARLFLVLLISLLFEVTTCAFLSPSSSTTSHVQQHLCIRNEKVALLQFKHSFVIKPSASPLCNLEVTNPKTQSWIEEVHTGGNNTNSTIGDCCSWEGVECDVSTGHVIRLFLDCSQLYGTITSDSTLFQLSHLRMLDLSSNNFNGSSISSAFGRSFPHLEYLSLSESNFSGFIAPEIAHLSQLISLHISSYLDGSRLRLEPEAFKMLIKNQTKLESLSLYGVNITSPIPEFMGNLSSLSYITLSSNGLYGELPHRMFDLPNLRELELTENDGLLGNIPKSNWSCSRFLFRLDLSEVRFSSELPDSCSPGCLKSLWFLKLNDCELFGSIPPWFGNLSKISFLDLFSNSFTGPIPETFSNLKHLDFLNLAENNLEGEIPNAFAQLKKLNFLNLPRNSFHGKFSHWLPNLTALGYLDMSSNKLTGPLPSNISEVKKLQSLYLSNNSIGGTLPLGLFALPLHQLDLSSNQLTGTIPSNLTGLRNSAVDPIDNNVSGSLGPVSFEDLKGFHFLDLSHNSIRGTLPLMPLSMFYLLISNNKLHGDIPPSICDSRRLKIINLSHNNLSGVIPKCITSFSNDLSVLNLGVNMLHGTIPMNFPKRNQIRSINLNGNHLEGQVPRSLTYCRNLEVLDLGNNRLNDMFPYWLESLPELQVLVLRHNNFHGMVGLSRIFKVPSFSKLRIFDLSHNEFIGPLPTSYFSSLNAMRSVNHTMTTLEYMEEYNYHDTVVMTLKGSEYEVQRILKVLATIDFSGNRFEGEIPSDIGNLIGIQSLNLSSNVLTGNIPLSLANLRLLESLDLSSNQLSGGIPQELIRITTLAVLNLSRNHLTGPIPQGLQFNTFQNDSYSGNLGLCGPPLTKKCSDHGAPHDQPSQEDDDEEGLFDGFGWKIVLLGYGCGTAFGLGIGFLMFSTRKPKRLVTFVEEELLRMTNRTGKRRAQGYKNGQRRG